MYRPEPPTPFIGPPRWLTPRAEADPPREPTPTHTEDPRARQAREEMEALQARRRCPSFTRPACGCAQSPGHCGREDRPLNVHPADCIACLREGWAE